jgi:hypothetical protein
MVAAGISAPERTATVYSVEPSGQTNQLKVEQVAQVTIGEYSILTSILINGESCLLGYHPSQDHFDIYWVHRGERWLVPADVKPVVGAGKDAITPFVLGNLPFVSVYTAASGIFEVYSIQNDLSFSKPYVFYRNHELAISKNFTTVKSFTQLGQVVFLGYNMASGYVAIYSASIIPVSANPGQPPLQMLPVWAHPWAPGWTHFAFFQLGGENFFFKINVANPEKVNVNIDHILDTLSSGTVEIGSHLPLAEALELTSVEPFTLEDGDPYFAAYSAQSGLVTLNRFHGNCLGWSIAARFSGPAGAHAAVPVTDAAGKVVLVFA